MPRDIEVLSEMRGADEVDQQGSMSYREWIRGRCVYDCAICNRRFFDSSEFWNHDELRGMPIQVYKNRYMTYYAPGGKRTIDCRVPGCRKRSVDWDRSKITVHFSKNHPEMKLKQYFESYVKRTNQLKQEAQNSSEDEVVEVDSGIETTPIQKVRRNLISFFSGKPGPISTRKERRNLSEPHESDDNPKDTEPLVKHKETNGVKLKEDPGLSKASNKRKIDKSTLACKPCPASKKPRKTDAIKEKTSDTTTTDSNKTVNMNEVMNKEDNEACNAIEKEKKSDVSSMDEILLIMSDEDEEEGEETKSCEVSTKQNIKENATEREDKLANEDERCSKGNFNLHYIVELDSLSDEDHKNIVDKFQPKDSNILTLERNNCVNADEVNKTKKPKNPGSKPKDATNTNMSISANEELFGMGSRARKPTKRFEEFVQKQKEEEERIRKRNTKDPGKRVVEASAVGNGKQMQESHVELLTNKNEQSQLKTWYDGTEYKCCICMKQFQDAIAVSHHMKSMHELEKTSSPYQRSIMPIKLCYHMCKVKVCGSKIVCNRVSISQHVRRAHEIDFMTYEEKFKLKKLAGGGQMAVYSKKAKEIFSDSLKSHPKKRNMELVQMQKEDEMITEEDIHLLERAEAAEKQGHG